MKYVGLLLDIIVGKKQRATKGCNIFTANLIDFYECVMADDAVNTNVFLCVHGLDSVPSGPSSLFCRFVQIKQISQRLVSRSLLCLSAQSSRGGTDSFF